MLNTVNLCGRLTADPELKRTQSGTAVISFCVSVDGNTKEKHTDFINCVAWRGTAEFISKYFSKGKMIIVSGRLQTRSYTTQDGSKRTATEVVAEQVFFAGDSGKTDSKEAVSNHSGDFTEVPEDDGELPF